MDQVIVYKGRTTVVGVSLGFDVSGDVFSSEIRDGKEQSSDLLATWDVSFENDGTDGELRLKLDAAATESVVKATGYMDLKRVSQGEPYNVWDEPIEVLFKSTVTA